MRAAPRAAWPDALLAPALAVTVALSAGGCGGIGAHFGGTTLQVTSLSSEARTLSSEYRTSLYAHDPARGTSFLLTDLTPEQMLSGEFETGQVVHLELLWVPKAGATPMDRTATNASIRHVIFAGGEVGVYGGAGFVQPRGRLGDDRVQLRVREASLSLLESTDGFVDLLSPAELVGRVAARHDRDATRRLYFNVSQRVTDALGRSMFVRQAGAIYCSMPVMRTRR